MTTATDPVNSVLMGAGGRSAAFKAHGDRVWGTIVSSEVRQQTDFVSGAPKTYDDGNPMMQVVITLLTDEHTDEDDDGLRKVYAKGQMSKAIAAAVRKAGAGGIADGGKLLVQYVGDAAATTKGMSPAKQYFAKYEPPTHNTVMPDQPDDDVPPIDDADLPF